MYATKWFRFILPKQKVLSPGEKRTHTYSQFIWFKKLHPCSQQIKPWVSKLDYGKGMRWQEGQGVRQPTAWLVEGIRISQRSHKKNRHRKNNKNISSVLFPKARESVFCTWITNDHSRDTLSSIMLGCLKDLTNLILISLF